MKSDIYKVFELLPKGAVHNLHLAGAVQADQLLKLTYEDCVYFSQRDKYFKVSRVSLIISKVNGYISIERASQVGRLSLLHGD